MPILHLSFKCIYKFFNKNKTTIYLKINSLHSIKKNFLKKVTYINLSSKKRKF